MTFSQIWCLIVPAAFRAGNTGCNFDVLAQVIEKEKKYAPKEYNMNEETLAFMSRTEGEIPHSTLITISVQEAR